MKTDHQISSIVGHCKKILWWLVVVVITGCCWAALTFFSWSYNSVHPHNVEKFRANALTNRFNDNLKINYSQINKTTFLIGHNCGRYVAAGDFVTAGLGNQMFHFAAALRIADLTGREVVLVDNHSVEALVDAFDLNVRMAKDVCPKYIFTEMLSFDDRLEKLVVNASETSNKTIYMKGYFQSWKYLRFIKDRVRYHFKFRPDARQFATKFLMGNIPLGWKYDFLRVGVHIRRGDFLQANALGFGFSVGTEAYFQKAMQYFVQSYGRIQFIVASMDTHWAKTYINFNNSVLANVTFSFGHTSVQDMAILSMCDHVIVSTGTFGWWSGWLAGGTTFFYADYPRRNSPISNQLIWKDYHPTNWIPMD